MQKLSCQVRRFIEQNIQYIDAKNYDQLYAKACEQEIQEDLTQVLLSTKIEFLTHITHFVPYMFKGTTIDQLVVPQVIDRIPYYCFQECTSLNQITLNNNIRIINKRAFASCTSLKSIEIPDSVEELEMYAFDHCSNLENIRLPHKISKISDGLFCCCENLTSISLPDTVTEIGTYAFLQSKIETIYFDGTKEQWKKIVKKRYFRSSSVLKTIVCSDGTIHLPGMRY